MQAPTPGKKLLYVTAKEARELKKVQMIGRQDPYLKLWVGRAGTKVKTHVHDDGGKVATWNESFVFDIKSIDPEEYLHFEVKNQNMTDSKTIGMGKVPFKTFGPAAKATWHTVYDVKGKTAGEVLLEGRVETGAGSSTSVSSARQPAYGGQYPNVQQQPSSRYNHHPPTSTYPSSQPSPAVYGGGSRPAAPTAYGAPPPAAGYGAPQTAQAGYGGVHQPQVAAFGGGVQPFPAVPRAPPPAPSTLNFGGAGGGTVAPRAPEPVTNGVYYGGGTAVAAGSGARPNGGGGYSQEPAMSLRWGSTPAAAPSVPQAGPAVPYHAPSAPSAPSAPPASGYSAVYSNGGGNAYAGGNSLPHGWEEKVSSDGRPYYVDHNTRTTHWGVMVPTGDAATANTRSKQHHQQQPQPSADVAGDRTVEPLIVFDWDDTILTSSWIQVNELLQATSYDELPLEVRRDLAQLERSVIKCLKNARQLGTVIIITNAESGWVELSAARFFVDVLPLLEGVPVISARSLFEPQFPGSPLCWKSAAFAYMMHDHFLDRPHWVQKKVVSIGDSNEEKVAMRIASGQHGTMAAKAVKFITGPDPEALSCQLDYVTKNLASVVASDSDVDIVLDASTIHGSYSLPLHSRGVYDDHPQQHLHHSQQQPPSSSSSSSSSSSAPSTPFSFRASSEAADPSPASRATARPASSPQVCSAGCAASGSGSVSPPDAAAGSSHEYVRPSTAAAGSSSSWEGSVLKKDEEPMAAAVFDHGNGRSRSRSSRVSSSSSSSSGGGGGGGTTAGSATTAGPSSSSPPSPQHLALKRRASSSPIPIPPAGHGPGHGRVGGGGSGCGKISGSSGEGGGDCCAQPFPTLPTEVDGPLSSYSSLSRAVAATATAERNVAQAPPSPSSASLGGGGDDEDAMALSPVSLDNCNDDGTDGGGCARHGGDGGDSAEGGCGRSAFGGGSPCPADNGGGGRDGDGRDRAMEMFGGAPVLVEMGAAMGAKEVTAGGDKGRNGMAVSGGGGDGVRRSPAMDGMVGVVERRAAAAVDTAPKA
eukprot:g12326.t2